MITDASVELCVLATSFLVPVGFGNNAERPLEQGMVERSGIVATRLVEAMEGAISV